MAYKTIFSVHAITQMARRRISTADVAYVLQHGEAIENYPHNTPYPSKLMLGWIGKRPLHVAVADNQIDEWWIIVTTYEPDPRLWDASFKKRK